MLSNHSHRTHFFFNFLLTAHILLHVCLLAQHFQSIFSSWEGEVRPFITEVMGAVGGGVMNWGTLPCVCISILWLVVLSVLCIETVFCLFQYVVITGKWQCPISYRMPHSPAPLRCLFIILQQQLFNSYCRNRYCLTSVAPTVASLKWIKLYPNLKAAIAQT